MATAANRDNSPIGVRLTFYADVRGLLIGHISPDDQDEEQDPPLDNVPILHAHHVTDLRSHTVDDLKKRCQYFVWNHFQIETSTFLILYF